MVCRHFVFVHGEMGACLKRIVRMKHNEMQCLANDNISLLGFSAVLETCHKNAVECKRRIRNGRSRLLLSFDVVRWEEK
jgi:hypothetical protein